MKSYLSKKLSTHLSTLNSQFSTPIKSGSILQKGFTLIELLVVIAVLGVLATIVLLAVNPGEQLMRARDTSRVAAVTQIGRSFLAYYTAQGGKYPVPSTSGGPAFLGTFLDTVKDTNDLKTIPTNPSGAGSTNFADCTAITVTATNSFQSGWCYVVNDGTTPTEGIIYSGLESQLNDSKCALGQTVWWAFSTTQGRGGFTCTANATTPPALSPTFVQ